MGLRARGYFLGASTTPFLSLLAKLGIADLRPDQFSTHVANRLRRHQIRGTIEQMRIMLACNTFFAPALSFQAWNSGANGLVIAWTAVILIFSWWLFFTWRKMYTTDGSVKDLRRFVWETFVNSAIWAVGMILFYPLVDGDQKTIVTAIMAGSLALGTVGFAQTPSAAFVYLGVQTISNSTVAFVCAFLHGSTTDYLIAVLSLAAGASVFNAALERGKASISAFINHEKLSQKTEVIDLLLKDYEQQATEWLWQTDADGNIVSIPMQISDMLGLSLDSSCKFHLLEQVSRRNTSESDEDITRLKNAYDRREEFHNIRLSILAPETGETRWILMKGRPQFTGDSFRGYRGIFADATASVVAERKVKFLATHDSLTELINRNSIQNLLCDLHQNTKYAIALLIDLDGFKQVNDSYGHHIGDDLLKSAADRLRNFQTVTATAARLGGDEFFVLLTSEDPLQQSTVACLADCIVDSLSQPYQVESFNIQLSASVGISSFPDDTDRGSELLSLADLALYEAKKNGRNRFEFFTPELQRVLNERIAVTERLKIAVKNGSIKPYYQSQHSLRDGKLVGFEALARWFDEELGFVGPDVFIAIAEQTGLIVELGEQLLRQACRDASAWPTMAPDQEPVLSVNFSPVQFARTDVAALVCKVLDETGYPPNLLEVEITEGVLISNKDKVATTLRELSALGVSLALDDFGTGYSSLIYLKELPLDRLKIDRAFVWDLQNGDPNPIVYSITQLGRSLGLSVIAEGIENGMQIDTLLEMGCDDGQGYLYSRPMPSDEVTKFMHQISDKTAERHR